MPSTLFVPEDSTSADAIAVLFAGTAGVQEYGFEPRLQPQSYFWAEASQAGEQEADEVRFQAFADQWRRETRYLSSDNDIAMNLAYQRIIGMGGRAIPLILRDLQHKSEPDHWFWALAMITQENPVPPEEAGDMLRMRERWLDWGRRRGHIRERSTRDAYRS